MISESCEVLPMSDEEFRVFVSRIPSKWTAPLMTEHFRALGFDATGSEIYTRVMKKYLTKRGVGNICYQFKNEGTCDAGERCRFSHSVEAEVEKERLNSGVVWFSTEKDMIGSLAIGSMHVGHRTVKISPYQSIEEGRDTNACIPYSNFNCSRGDDCKFSHSGVGGVTAVGKPYEGRKFQCLSWKSKGKCSKGESCGFIHTAEIPGKKILPGTPPRKKCRNWIKYKGKCKRGDECTFSHDVTKAGGTSGGEGGGEGVAKKRKIDGYALVELHKKLKSNVGNRE